jgi:hypothetical protein
LSLLVELACAYETQGLIEQQAELGPEGTEKAGEGGGVLSSSGSGGASGSAAFGGSPGGGAPSGGAGGTFSNPFGTPSAGRGGGSAGGGAAGRGGAGGGGSAGSGGNDDPEPDPCRSTELDIADATASSQEDATLSAEMASDGVATTRWSSAHSEPQWIVFELENDSLVDRVVIRWEAAHATDYRVEVADQANGPWTALFREQDGDGGNDDVDDFMPRRGSFVRIEGLERATAYGFSIFVVELYGDSNPACE